MQEITPEEPKVVVISNRKWDDYYYLVSSKEELNQFAFDYIKKELKEYGNYRYYKDVLKESEELASDNVRMTEEEVEALPEHIRKDVKAERERYKKEEKIYSDWAYLLDLMKKTIKEKNIEKCWAMILRAKDYGWHEEGDRIYLERISKVEVKKTKAKANAL